MSDLLKEIIDSIGVEFLLGNNTESFARENCMTDAFETKVFPDFDHVTVI